MLICWIRLNCAKRSELEWNERARSESWTVQTIRSGKFRSTAIIAARAPRHNLTLAFGTGTETRTGTATKCVAPRSVAGQKVVFMTKRSGTEPLQPTNTPPIPPLGPLSFPRSIAGVTLLLPLPYVTRAHFVWRAASSSTRPPRQRATARPMLSARGASAARTGSNRFGCCSPLILSLPLMHSWTPSPARPRPLSPLRIAQVGGGPIARSEERHQKVSLCPVHWAQLVNKISPTPRAR